MKKVFFLFSVTAFCGNAMNAIDVSENKKEICQLIGKDIESSTSLKLSTSFGLETNNSDSSSPFEDDIKSLKNDIDPLLEKLASKNESTEGSIIIKKKVLNFCEEHECKELIQYIFDKLYESSLDCNGLTLGLFSSIMRTYKDRNYLDSKVVNIFSSLTEEYLEKKGNKFIVFDIFQFFGDILDKEKILSALKILASKPCSENSFAFIDSILTHKAGTFNLREIINAFYLLDEKISKNVKFTDLAVSLLFKCRNSLKEKNLFEIFISVINKTKNNDSYFDLAEQIIFLSKKTTFSKEFIRKIFCFLPKTELSNKNILKLESRIIDNYIECLDKDTVEEVLLSSLYQGNIPLLEKILYNCTKFIKPESILNVFNHLVLKIPNDCLYIFLVEKILLQYINIDGINNKEAINNKDLINDMVESVLCLINKWKNNKNIYSFIKYISKFKSLFSPEESEIISKYLKII